MNSLKLLGLTFLLFLAFGLVAADVPPFSDNPTPIFENTYLIDNIGNNSRGADLTLRVHKNAPFGNCESKVDCPASVIVSGATGNVNMPVDVNVRSLFVGKSAVIDSSGKWIGPSTGLVGSAGPEGPKGDTGAAGLQGPQGLKGDAGPAGPQGLQGLKGDKGDTGSQGPQGLKGETGPTGPQGSQGPRGGIGATGLQGPKGDTGATGPQGPKGESGRWNAGTCHEATSYLEQNSLPQMIVSSECAADEFLLAGYCSITNAGQLRSWTPDYSRARFSCYGWRKDGAPSGWGDLQSTAVCCKK